LAEPNRISPGQLRKNAGNSDVLTYSESIATVKLPMRTFRKHHTRQVQ
jgi:hypothetical protein